MSRTDPHISVEEWRRLIAKTPAKFRNVPTPQGGVRFGSKAEAERAAELQWLEQAGVISHLVLDKRKLRYALVVNGVRIGSYIADAAYIENGAQIVEDTKSAATRKTPWWRRTRRLMQACYPEITLREIVR